MADFAGSAFIWADGPATPRRNEFVVFVRRFTLEARPDHFSISLFADTRYRLWVNSSLIGCGPARFFTQHPEYDAFDIAHALAEGENEIVVEVNWFGASSFQTMPDGQAGFIAAGGIQGCGLETPGEWLAFNTEEWDSQAPAYSFAQGPVEMRDLRLASQRTPAKVVVLDGARCPWPKPEPPTGTPLPFNLVQAGQPAAQGGLAPSILRGFNAVDSRQNQPGSLEWKGRPFCGFEAHIWSPRNQEVEMECFWSEQLLNGQPVAAVYDARSGNHGSARVRLNKGWNHLFGSFEVLTEIWCWLTGFPPDSGVSMHATQDKEDPNAFLVSPVMQERPKPEGGRDGWRKESGDPMLCTPARVTAWNRLVPGAEPPCVFVHKVEGEFLGHIRLDVEGPAGTIVDVTTDDWQKEDGTAWLYLSNPFCDTTDRFILSGGRQTLDLFHPRGGKVIQATLRSPGEPAKLHGMSILSRQIWAGQAPQFSCGDPVLDWTWKAAFRTLTSSTDDAYSDCPWRERGSYIGDSLVSLHLSFLLTHDLRTPGRTLAAFGRGQREDGMLAGCAPAWLRATHEDFTLIWVLAIRDWINQTGSLDLPRQVLPCLKRIWASPAWKRGESGLFNLNGTRAFFDWGIIPSERIGDGNAGINILLAAAAKASGEILSALGEPDSVSGLAQELEKAIFAELWHTGEGRLLAGMGQETPALHANVLALWSGLGAPEQRASILDYLEPRLLSNLSTGLASGEGKGHLELYFMHYLLPALAEMGRPDLAETMIQDHYGYLMSLGDDTLPECFNRVSQGGGSRCHTWSGAPAVYAARYVLGLRPLGPNRLLFSPIVHGISQARGEVCHGAGTASAEWRRVDGRIVGRVQAPDGVVVEPGPGVVLEA